MRRSRFEPRMSMTIALVIANVAVFILQTALAQFSHTLADYYFTYLPLSLEGLKHGFVWQLVTYQFMHGGFLHLLFNCFAIYVFGRDVEDALGRKSFLALYFASGVMGGLVQTAAGLLPIDRFAGPVVGASAAALGLVAAFAMLFPDRILLLFFIIPMRARFLLWLSAAFAVYGVFAPPPADPSAVHIADAAHLGGMLTGVLFIRYAMYWEWPRFRPNHGRPVRRLVRVPVQKSSGWGRAKDVVDEDLPPEEFLSKEVDPILDKISAHGIQSLTERERRILEAARVKMGKR